MHESVRCQRSACDENHCLLTGAFKTGDPFIVQITSHTYLFPRQVHHSTSCTKLSYL